MNVTQALDQLAEYQAQRDLLDLQKQELKDKILTPEIKAQLAEIEVEFSEKAAVVNDNIQALETEIKSAVAAYGSSVKGAHLQAVYAKPRITWDNAKLYGLMILIPQLKEARKEGAPSVSIRKV